MRGGAPACLAVLAACAGSSTKAPEATAAAPTVVVVAPTAEPPPAPPPVAAEDAGTDAGPSPREACRGSAFDVAKLPAQCASRELAHVPRELAVSLSVEPVTVRGGDTVTVTITMKNPMTEDLVVALSGCDFIEVQAFQGGRRADYKRHPSCGPGGGGCGTGSTRLVLGPGGTITQRLAYQTEKATEGPGCVATKTPLAPGRYALKVASDKSHLLHEPLEKLSTPLVVTR